MTLSAAEILGVADRLGSLTPGKDATLIVTTDHPAQATCVVKRAFIRGRPISLDNKHTRDAARFGARPAGRLPPARTDLKGPPSQTRPPAASLERAGARHGG
jgi:adenine deaminase